MTRMKDGQQGSYKITPFLRCEVSYDFQVSMNVIDGVYQVVFTPDDVYLVFFKYH
jgi:hypothetical protein